MSSLPEIERGLADWMRQVAPDGAPPDAVEAALSAARGTRPMPRWLALLRIAPLTSEAGALVGAPPARVAYLAAVLAVSLMVLVLMMAALAGGARLLRDIQLPPTGLARNGLIAYDSEGDIWVAEADGSSPRRLTSHWMTESTPVWSPDGTRLAFLAVKGAGTDVVVIDSSGANRTVVAGGSRAVDLHQQAWSHDGRRLVYSAQTGAGPRIFIASVDGSGVRQVGDAGLDARTPTWSPDGEMIAFDGVAPGKADVTTSMSTERGVYVMTADGEDLRRVSSVRIGRSSTPARPLWSPDSQLIAVNVRLDAEDDVFVFQRDGGTEMDISHRGVPELYPAWSPDGDRIAFLQTSGVARVVVVGIDGSDWSVLSALLLHDCPLVWEAAWSPDGTRIVVPASPSELGIIDPSGGQPMLRVPVAGGTDHVTWQRLPP